MVSIEDVDRLAHLSHSTVISCNMTLNLDRLLDNIWNYLGLTRVFTKKRGQPPDLAEPVVLTHGRHGVSVSGPGVFFDCRLDSVTQVVCVAS
jgi:uncharacterized protein